MALCLQNLWFISVKKLATSCYVVGVLFPWKFKLIYENFSNWSSNESKTLLLSDQSQEGRRRRCRQWEWGV